MKWRLSVHGAIVVMAIGVSSVAVAQPREPVGRGGECGQHRDRS